MFVDFMYRHEVVCIIISIVITSAVVLHYERWKDRKVFDESTRHIWQCVQFGGGAMVYTPHPMTRDEAFEWCVRIGHISYVDEEHHKIFYRSRS